VITIALDTLPGESVVPDNEKVTTSADQYENTKPSGEEAE
jgi:hypothetical protein